jgi:SAM-dependent methyltransferase
MQDLESVEAFYDAYETREWDRLVASPEARIIYHLHRKFLKGHYGPGARVLDAGCGPGRFSLDMAAAGARVTLFDLSGEQLRIARTKLAEHGLAAQVEEYCHGDVRDLSRFADHTFDTVVCYGAVLNYLLEDAASAVREFVRVVKPGGSVLVSVNSRMGTLRWFVNSGRKEPQDFLGRPDYWNVRRVATEGDFPLHAELGHPARHLYLSGELSDLLSACGLCNVQLATAPALVTGYRSSLAAISQHPEAWQTLLELEEGAFQAPGLLDAGYFMLGKGRTSLA